MPDDCLICGERLCCDRQPELLTHYVCSESCLSALSADDGPAIDLSDPGLYRASEGLGDAHG